MRKAQRIRQQLGGTPNLFEPFPWKPKGMHWATYSRLYQQEHEANHASLVGSLKRFLGTTIFDKLRVENRQVRSGCEFNRSLQHIGEIVQPVFQSLTFFLGVR